MCGGGGFKRPTSTLANSLLSTDTFACFHGIFFSFLPSLFSAHSCKLAILFPAVPEIFSTLLNVWQVLELLKVWVVEVHLDNTNTFPLLITPTFHLHISLILQLITFTTWRSLIAPVD